MLDRQLRWNLPGKVGGQEQTGLLLKSCQSMLGNVHGAVSAQGRYIYPQEADDLNDTNPLPWGQSRERPSGHEMASLRPPRCFSNLAALRIPWESFKNHDAQASPFPV